ncbi:MAG TPA: hypothetical protein DCL15_15250 [Chloroflexi bacterium]|nr:hypothetical protein [Chloroflexota bacterium]
MRLLWLAMNASQLRHDRFALHPLPDQGRLLLLLACAIRLRMAFCTDTAICILPKHYPSYWRFCLLAILYAQSI